MPKLFQVVRPRVAGVLDQISDQAIAAEVASLLSRHYFPCEMSMLMLACILLAGFCRERVSRSRLRIGRSSPKGLQPSVGVHLADPAVDGVAFLQSEHKELPELRDWSVGLPV